MNDNESTKIYDFVRNLNVLRLAFVIGIFAMTCLIFFFKMKGATVQLSNEDGIFTYLCPLLAIFGIVAGNRLYVQKLNSIDLSSGLDHKLDSYRQARIIEYALLEGPALICVVAGMQTQNALYMIIAAVLAVYLFSRSVSESSVRLALNL